MADSSVRQAGGDFTTLAAALADAGTVATDTVTISGAWTIDDTAACIVADDNITIHIDQSDASYHNGIYDESTNHHRLVVDALDVIDVFNTGVVIDGLAIVQAGVSVSAEGIHLTGAGPTATIKNCLIIGNGAVSDQDGIHCGLVDITINVENCMVYNWGRAGLHSQLDNSTQTWNVNSLTIYLCERNADASGGGISLRRTSAGTDMTMNVYNTMIFLGGVTSAEDYNERDSGGVAVWNIDNSIASDTSILSRDAGAVGALQNRILRDATAGGLEVLVIDITTALPNINLLLINDPTNNDAQDAHSNLTGAGMTLPILDITAEVRDRSALKIDIGADAFPPPAAGRSQVLLVA